MSSISSSFGRVEVAEVSCDPSSTRSVDSVEWGVPSCCNFPLPVLVMVVSDHPPFGLTAAFFKESIRRVAMMGMKSADALWDTS